MIADMLTKPMGGAKFREFRRIMNYELEESKELKTDVEEE
jgi:hypothetical protein